MATKKNKVNKEVWPKIVKGTHLTVYTYEDGSTKLKWDDEALLKEIKEVTNLPKVKQGNSDVPKKKVTKLSTDVPVVKKRVKTTKV